MANEKSVSLMETTLSNTLGSQRIPGSGKPPSAARLDAGLVRAIAVEIKKQTIKGFVYK